MTLHSKMQGGRCRAWTALNLRTEGVAVREFPLETGHADYLLFVDQKAAGIIEAKAEGTTSPFSPPSATNQATLRRDPEWMNR